MLNSNKIFQILSITKFDELNNIPKEISALELQTTRVATIDCNRLRPLYLTDAFEFQVQLQDLLKVFPQPTLAQIKSRPPLISFKNAAGVFDTD